MTLALGICLKSRSVFSYVCRVSLGPKHHGLFTLPQFQVVQRPTLWVPSWGSCKNNSCMRVCMFSHSVMTDSLQPRVSVEFPGKNTGVGYRFLLEGIFSSQGSNPCLLHWQLDSLPLHHLGSPNLAYTAYVYFFNLYHTWQPTPVFLPGEPHGQRSMTEYNPWGPKESNTI